MRMFGVRQWFVALTVWLVFFFNIERVIHPVDITKYTYVFVVLVAIIILLIPNSQRIPLWLLTGVPSTLLILMQIWVEDPVLGVELPVSITEISSIVLTGLLARQMNRHLLEFEVATSKIAINYVGSHIADFDTEQNVMYRELKRARLYERPLSMLMIKFTPDSLNLQLPRLVQAYKDSLINQMAMVSVVKVLDNNLFDTDIIAQLKDTLVVLLPELASKDIEKVSQKIQDAVKRETGIDLRIGAANYPDNAATFERLLDLAKDELAFASQNALSGIDDDQLKDDSN
ncbi:MAG TPA: hypothetical protein G4N96_13770 [Chloroflexi bacterium]|nr:hypothetical protein [Chloroflexota bacterium]